MIPITDLSWQSQSWQAQLQHSIRTNAALANALGLSPSEVETPFPVNVPLPYLSRIEPGNPDDPLLRQVLSTPQELVKAGVRSPLQEEAFARGFGLLQKYQGRSLVITTGACAIHCRYCFRRHFPYESHQPSTEDWQGLLQSIIENPEIEEIILSGGDPLMQNDKRLRWIFTQIDKIAHVTTIRLHTRMPVVLPARITPALLEFMTNSRCQIVLVNHINHGNEIDEEVAEVMARLQRSGVSLLNQSVLLRGVNDSVTTLVELSKRLHTANILPYYLHLMDPVLGAQHFDVPEDEGKRLMNEVREQLPGYLVPRLVREIPFRPSKTLVT